MRLSKNQILLLKGMVAESFGSQEALKYYKGSYKALYRSLAQLENEGYLFKLLIQGRNIWYITKRGTLLLETLNGDKSYLNS